MKNSVPEFISHYYDHLHLISDRLTQDKFYQAIRQTVRNGDVVVDIGTGSGIHAMFACLAGAKKVYAIEGTPIIEFAKRAARENGLLDRIRFIRGFSQEIDLPQKADVVIHHMGVTGVLQNLTDARRRFLKKGGDLIPFGVEFSFVPVDDRAVYSEKIDFWSRSHYGLKFDSFRPFMVNQLYPVRFEERNFIARPKRMPLIDLRRTDTNRFNWRIKFTAKKSGVLSGLGSWYSYRLSEKSESRGAPLVLQRDSWMHKFLPLENPLKIMKNDLIQADISLILTASVPDGAVWNWTVKVNGTGSEQSSFKSLPLSGNFLMSTEQTRLRQPALQ